MAMTVSSMGAAATGLRFLNASQRQSATALHRISSGLKINQAKDGPAGLIISELLNSQAFGTQRALRNTIEAYNLMGVAEGTLGGIQDNLRQMKSLAVHALNSGVTTTGQVSADQAEIDSLLSTIQRSAATTRYADQPLLNGSGRIRSDVDDPSGLLRSASFTGADAGTREVSVAFAGGAEAQAERAYLETAFAGDGATLAEDQSFVVGGAEGSVRFDFAAGTAIEDMAASINARAGGTGVEAYAIRDVNGEGATQLRLVSADYGANASVRVDQRAGDAFARAGETAYDAGQDASVVVNGTATLTRGLTAGVNGDARGTLAFSAGRADATTIAQTGYDRDDLVNADAARSATLSNVTGGRAFQLGEGSGDPNRDVAALPDANVWSLGQVTQDGRTYSLQDLYGGGDASLARDPELAMRIIDQAITDVSGARGALGAYQANTLETNANNLTLEYINLLAAESNIRAADLASEITELTRSQLMQQVGLRAIRQANQQSRNTALTLLGVG